MRALERSLTSWLRGECLFEPCRVRTCIRAKGVDFCFQKEFPYEDAGLHARLEGVWRQNNELMKRYGVTGYYEKIKDNPGYPEPMESFNPEDSSTQDYIDAFVLGGTTVN